MAEYVSVAKAAQILGVKRTRLQELIRNGELVTFEGRVEVEQLRKSFPALAFIKPKIEERTRIIKESAYGERIQKLVSPPAEVLQAKIKRLAVDLNVERTKARDYQDVIESLMQKLSDMQQIADPQQREIIYELNIWLIARFDSTKGE
jgi:hypothetical protein